MLSREIGWQACRLAIDDGVDLTLTVQRHIFGTVVGDMGKAHAFQYRLDDVRGGRGKFDELEAHKAHGVFKQVGHDWLLGIAVR